MLRGRKRAGDMGKKCDKAESMACSAVQCREIKGENHSEIINKYFFSIK